MKSTLTHFYLALSLILGFSSLGQATTLSDLDLQSKLESAYTTRLKQSEPDLHFSIAVNIKGIDKLTVDSLNESPAESELYYPIEKRIQSVYFMSEEDVKVEHISDIIGLPVDKIKYVQLQKKIPKPTPAPIQLTFEQELKKYVSEPVGFIQTAQVSLATIVGLLFVIVFTVAAFVFSGLFRKLILTLSQSFQTLKFEKPAHSYAFATPVHPVSETKYSDTQLRAMLAECYWTQHDAEASALIRQHSRMDAYESLRFGKEYVDYLKNITPVASDALHFLNDPYFLRPDTAFNELSVRDTPLSALRSASQLRFEAKNANTLELLLVQTDPERSEGLPTQASALRTLGGVIRVYFKNVKEEDEILSNPEISEAVKLSLPSLYRLYRLDQSAYEQMIEEFSLQELAEAWVGPEWLLSSLDEKMNPKKRTLFHELRARIAPNRASAAFQKITTRVSRCSKIFPAPESDAFHQAA